MEWMNPQQQLPPNYLDEIAPQAQKRSFAIARTPLLVLIGIIAVVLVSILAIVIGQINGGRLVPWEQLSARLTSTSAIVQSSNGKIKNSQLRSTNSSLNLLLTNTQRDLAAPLVTLGIKSDKLSKSVVAAESSDEMIARLEDARLNAKYDSTYAREMSYQLANLLTLLRQMYSSSSSETNKAFLTATYESVEPIQKSLSEFSASNE